MLETYKDLLAAFYYSYTYRIGMQTSGPTIKKTILKMD